MNSTSRLWRGLGIVFVLSFAVLGWLGRESYLAAPPIPEAVRSSDGSTLFTRERIQLGQQAWFKAGGQQLGTVCGHGSYVAPDWSADWLHREGLALRDIFATGTYGRPYDSLSVSAQAGIDARLKTQMRANTYDAASGVITVSSERAVAIGQVASHYESLFGPDPALRGLRTQYAMPDNALPSYEDRASLAAFFFWSSWSRRPIGPANPACPTRATGPMSPSWVIPRPTAARSGRLSVSSC